MYQVSMAIYCPSVGTRLIASVGWGGATPSPLRTLLLSCSDMLMGCFRRVFSCVRRSPRTKLSSRFDACLNVDRKIAEMAREYIWDFGVHHKDAIHLASAIHAKIEIFDTFDEKLLKLSGKLGNPPLNYL